MDLNVIFQEEILNSEDLMSINGGKKKSKDESGNDCSCFIGNHNNKAIDTTVVK